MRFPLSVAVASIIQDNKILLINRVSGSYTGKWALPGGKIEQQEHLSQAIIREIKEEAGIKSTFKNFLGVVSEHLVENNQIIQHFLLNVCSLEAQDMNIVEGNEGKLNWFDLDSIDELREKIIPSDYLIIQKIIKSQEKNHFECVIEKIGEEYHLRKFT